jgi:regulator of replication initiation timing
MLTEESIKANPIYGVIASITNNKNYDNVIPKLKNTLKLVDNISKLYIETTDDDMVVKNISILSFITFTVFKQLLVNTLSNKTDNVTEVIKTVSSIEKDNVKITCDIIGLLVSSLKTQLQNTIVDNDLLKMSVEALREKRKQELINAYKVDEEERELQKQLKKLGLQNWADILTGEDDIVSEDVIASTKLTSIVKDEYEEEKDFVYSTYKGENADDDEVDEDYVSYESYDN